ncbi:MAG: oligosaccharide flippase family protein [Solirubrobacteraceae bacterium]
MPRDRAPADDRPSSGFASLAVRGACLAGTGYGLTQAISFGTYLALGRLLSPAAFGTFAAGSVFVGVGLVVGESGMAAALVQRHDRLEEAFNSAFVATLASGLLLSLLALAAAPLVGLFFGSHRAALVAAALAGTMLLRLSLVVPCAHFQRRFSFLRRVVLDPLGACAFAVAAILAAMQGLGVWSLVLGAYAQLGFELVVSWSLVGWRPRPQRASLRVWRELAGFGRPLVLGEVLRMATFYVPVLLLGRFAGTRTLGQFSYAYRVGVQPISAVVDVGSYVLFPSLARISQDAARFRAGVLRALRWLCAASFASGLLLVPLGMPAVVLAFGARWRGAGYGVMALGVYCAAVTLDSVASETWKAAGRPELLPRMHLVALVLTAACVGALAPLGLVPVTVGLALAAIGVAAYALRGVSAVLGTSVRTLASEIWPPAAAGLIMVLAITPLEYVVVRADTRGLLLGGSLLVAEAVAGLIVFASSLAVISPGSRLELRALLGGIGGRTAGARIAGAGIVGG